MNKTLKFAPNLVPLVIAGTKTSTWRLWDDKGLSKGDVVDLLDNSTLRVFATAYLVKVTSKAFGEFNEADKEGHEKFTNDKEMYETYSGYYNRVVDEKTPVKIIHFKLINKN